MIVPNCLLMGTLRNSHGGGSGVVQVRLPRRRQDIAGVL
jgi:hypothetical protein